VTFAAAAAAAQPCILFIESRHDVNKTRLMNMVVFAIHQ
jgi:hypothetical protein